VAVVHLDVRRRIASLPFAEARPDGAALVAVGTALQWWLPAADTVQVLDPLRWEVLERHALAAPVRAVVAASAGVWAWVDEAPAPLRLWRDRRWQRPAADVITEPLRALALDAQASTLLGAGSDRVWELDAQGRVTRAWRFDAGAALRGVAAFPA
jgi:PAS domain-containing protein